MPCGAGKEKGLVHRWRGDPHQENGADAGRVLAHESVWQRWRDQSGNSGARFSRLLTPARRED